MSKPKLKSVPKTPPPKANGVLPLLLTWPMARARVDVIGGPFDAYRPTINADYGVCVRAERVPATADRIVPINDFDVPQPKDRALMVDTVKETFRRALRGERVWIGCMGGFGRTGLFMAILAKAAGVQDPVAYVRATYYPHAVETPAQALYVSEFDVSEIRSWLMWHTWGQFWGKALTWWVS